MFQIDANKEENVVILRQVQMVFWPWEEGEEFEEMDSPDDKSENTGNTGASAESLGRHGL